MPDFTFFPKKNQFCFEIRHFLTKSYLFFGKAWELKMTVLHILFAPLKAQNENPFQKNVLQF
jgi:hypothetical protein